MTRWYFELESILGELESILGELESDLGELENFLRFFLADNCIFGRFWAVFSNTIPRNFELEA